MEHSVKLEMEVLKEIAVAVHAQQTTQSWVISRCCFADLHKEIYKDFFYPRAQLLFCLSNVLFRFVPVPALIFSSHGEVKQNHSNPRLPSTLN